MSLSKSLDLEHAQSAVPCDSCRGEVPGVYYCIECKETFCDRCEKFHKKFTKDHNVILRTQIADFDTNILSCDVHEEQATLHCEKCGIPVCIKCVTGEHQGHKMVDLNTKIERKRSTLQSDINEIQGCLLPKMIKQEDDIRNDRDNYNKRIEIISQEIEKENETFQKELNRVNCEKLKSLKITQDRDLKTFDANITEIQMKIDVCQKMMSEYQNALERNSVQSIINLVQRKEPLPQVGNNPELPEGPLFFQKDIEIDLMTSLALSFYKIMSPRILSTFKSPLQGTSSICINQRDETWLGGDQSRELVMVDTKGRESRRIKVQNRINALVITGDGHIIISPHPSDSRIIRKLDDNEKDQHVYDTSPSYGTGISCTADRKILISTTDGRVLRTNSDGTDPKEIYRGSGTDTALQAVENIDGNIYISDRKNSSIVLVNKEGAILLSIKSATSGKKLRSPVGLVIDKLGNVLCADRDNDCIFMIDQKHLMRELVGHAHGVHKPRWLAVDNDNNLWITQYDAFVKVVQYIAY